ncbi:DNA-methyltransferase [Rossellomorea marisflavi]|uniref:DNA-methyltransferase n=1 Tax=Rossellomorea marisflavi TaxID=189381 RepID=UPI003F9F695A
MDKNVVLKGDCLDLLKTLPNKAIDMILCDLPYGTTQNKWDSIIPLDELWKEYNRVIKDNGAIVLFGAQPFTSKLVMSNLKQFRYSLVWEKNKSSGFLNANRMPLRIHEDILVFYKKLPTYNPQKTTGHKPANKYTKHSGDGDNYGKTKTGLSGGGNTDRHPTTVLKFPVINNDDKEKFHSTQKPVALYEWLIKTYSNEGELVLDNCSGSGTLGIACLNTNRSFICMEKDDVYYEKSVARIEAHQEINKEKAV